jgi:sugar-specific transcriptional regulator TrmB
MALLNEVLEQAGLDDKEASVYNTLINNGGLTVLELAKLSDQKRTNLYNILENLEHKNLVQKIEEEKTTKYYPNSPTEIEKLLEQRQQQMEMAKLNFELLLNPLQSKYNLVSHKPIVTYLEGIKGLQRLYDDIIDTGEDILLIRSTYDMKRQDVDELVKRQIIRQVKRGINSKVIGPLEHDSKETYLKYDGLRLVERRHITDFPFDLPTQILVYGNKTSIATIREEIIITLIDNKEISDTFRALFWFIWNISTPKTQKLFEEWERV